ncbi:Sensor protein CiaH [Streptococcus thermophilus]|uniref:histidine kinase n=1 Tax=Streptococcus thermophilus TaxID=1308 RepID=A0A8D6U641_STRTR|nr:HAMP domain-containing sensor histidine kinase [Streptococcus thermophilus]CAD0137261.1 Sensor protein CiaH [Streptococcus thermophilus]CAD0152171.1 Sensor protein CiaH [Streptococcus thermophilus]
MLTKFFNYLFRRIKSDGFKSFIHFFATFSGIFLIMTVMILQILRYGVYSNVDSSLKEAVTKTNSYLEMEMLKREFFLTSDVDQNNTATIYQEYDSKASLDKIPNSGVYKTKSKKIKSKIEDAPHDLTVAANTSVLVLDKNGKALNVVDKFSSLSNLPIDKNTIDVISKGSAQNYFDQTENYRLITEKVDNSFYPDAKYVVIAINTTQLEEATERYVKLIVIMMSFFWLLSIAASLYLAKWSRRPIQESLEKQKTFVENASHELRTPLAVIQNRLESLFRKPESTILDNSENIAYSLDEVRNMRLLTTNLLNLTRRDDGIKPEIETLDSSFFDKVFTNYATIAEESEKVFTAQNQVGRSIKTDKTLLKQLMTILFDNAIKYTEDDGQVILAVRTNDRHLYITVADNGPGIADEDKKKIFDRFYCVDKARTRQKGGFGLGLSLAQQIVLALKGTIIVKDNQPKGTIFEVKITGV